jgi:hypothetical protein
MVSGTAQRMLTGIKAIACRNLDLSSTRFENIQSHGIYAENSRLSTKYCLFNKIGSTGVSFLGSPTPSTRAFWTSNSDSLNDMRYGANVLYAYHKMDTAKINNVDVGILYRSINARTVQHEVCRINARKIDMEIRNSNPLSFEVRYGNYSTENPSNFDINERGNILLSNVGPPVSKASQMPNNFTVRFHNNSMKVKNAVYGVRSTSSNAVELYENIIELQTHGATGVELINNAHNNLQCNTIQGKPGEELTALTGVNAVNAPFNRYTCNNTIRTLTGMRFEGVCGDTKLRGNDMGRGTYGLKIDAPAALAAQTAIGWQFDTASQVSYRYFGNQWAVNTSDSGNTNGIYGAWHYSPDPIQIRNSLFEIRKELVTFDPIKNRTGWFVPKTTGNTFYCKTSPTSSVCDAPGFGGFHGGGGSSAKPNNDDFNQKLIQNGLGITHTGVSTGTTWMGRRGLLSSIWNNQGQGNGSLQSGFYQAQQQTDLGQLTAAEAMLYQPSAITTDQTNLLTQQIAQGQLQRMVLMEALLEAKDAGDSATVMAQLQTLEAQLQSWWTSMDQLTATHQQQLSASAQAALAATVGVAAQSLPAQNLKTANTVHFTLLSEGRYELHPQEVTSLEPVAAQCPYVGGDGVYKARTLLNNHNAEIYRYAPEHGCSALNQGLKEGRAEEVPVAWISPNPAWHTARVQWDPAKLQPVRIRVVNVNGQVLLEAKPDATTGVHELNVSTLTNGQYVVQVLNQWEAPVQMTLVKISEE